MKTKYTLFRRGGVFYAQESATGKQTSLRTKDETEAKDGNGFNIQLESTPIDGHITLRIASEKTK